MEDNRNIVLIACAVFRDALSQCIGDPGIPVIYMDYGLHLTPRKMRAAIQEQIDALEEPHRVLIGFGLCGNGLVGLRSRQHTLLIPRVDDCISLFLGSRAAYLEEFHANPATYYLTPGWIESGGEPWSEHRKCCDKYGPDKAALISDAMYGKYRRLCFVAFTPRDLERYRPRALQIAAFCRERWGWEYQERVGSDALIRRLFEFGRAGDSAARAGIDEFVVVQPEEEVRQEQFMLSLVALQKE